LGFPPDVNDCLLAQKPYYLMILEAQHLSPCNVCSGEVKDIKLSFDLKPIARIRA